MPTFTSLVPRDRQAAIAGKVIDASTRQPLEGVTIAITTMPASFAKWLSLHSLPYGDGWASRAERPDRTQTSADGAFRFLDLPDSPLYTLTFSLPKALKRYGTVTRNFAVARDANGRIALTFATIELPPTGVRGKVLGGGQALALAEVRVLGTGELAYADAEGAFLLACLDPGARQLSISSPGFTIATRAVTLAEGVVASLDDIVLESS